MGGFFGVVSGKDCVFRLFYGTDYHSHLATRRAGLAVYDNKNGFERAIHNIENTNFRPKFEKDAAQMKGNIGIGSISDFEPQPLIVRSHFGTFALTTVGKINNAKEISDKMFSDGYAHFLEMSSGQINPTELVAALISKGDTIEHGIRMAQETIHGSMSLLLMTKDGIYAARDIRGRTPISIGRDEDSHCVCFESFSFLNLGYKHVRDLGPGEIVFLTQDDIQILHEPEEADSTRICTFLWIYYGYPGSVYEGADIEKVRNRCGKMLAKRDLEHGMTPADSAAGIPDSGVAHAIGYANESGIPYQRPFVKYTPTWPRSFMPVVQSSRNLIAKMKLIPVHELIEGKRLLLIDDSIVRGTQLRETTQFLYDSGAKEVHIRPACPPIVFACKFLNFSRTGAESELIARRTAEYLEGGSVSPEALEKYTSPDEDAYEAMVEHMRKEMNFTTLRYNRLDDMIDATGIKPCRLCTYCWNGKE